jgi:hypothetical protein
MEEDMICGKCIFRTVQEVMRHVKGFPPEPYYKDICGLQARVDVQFDMHCNCEETRKVKLAEQVDWFDLKAAIAKARGEE